MTVRGVLTKPLAPDVMGALVGDVPLRQAPFSAVTIATEGVFPVVLNHTSNLWGVQVWWDLLFSLSIAYFLILPRAKAQGMNLTLWTVFILATASIGLLAMCSRLFWLEGQSKARSA